MKGVVAAIALLLVLCALGLGQAKEHGGPPIPAKEAPQHPSATDIYEAVLRYQIDSWDLHAESYCVKIKGKDATGDLLERLQPLHVKGASGCRTKNHPQRVVDKKTGKVSVFFNMEEIKWRTYSNAEVDGGYECGDLCAAEGTYHVTWDDGRWVVTKFQIVIQS